MADSFYDRGMAPGKQQRKKRSGGSRFWLPSGGPSRRVISLSHKPYTIWEHQYKGLDGKWGHFEVCLQENGIGPCPLCHLADDKKYPVSRYHGAAVSILDATPFEVDGKQFKASKRVVMLKGDPLGIMEIRFDEHKTLKYIEFKVTRAAKPDSDGNDRSPSIGNMWDYVRTWTAEEIEEEFGAGFSQEHNWDEVFKPKPFEHLAAIAEHMGAPVAVGASASTPQLPEEEEIDYDDE